MAKAAGRPTIVHRGASGDMAAFAVAFVQGRIAGFEKDIKICLTPVSRSSGSGVTYAYFPALAACTSTLEYLTALVRGNTRGIGWRQVSAFATEYMRQPDYDAETVRILFEALRHPVAHRGIASGVWVDRNKGVGQARRVVWKISVGSKRPACQVMPENGSVKRDSPWTCSFSHRVHVHLKALSVDICDAANEYTRRVASEAPLQKQFELCMRQLYPR